MKAPRLIRLYQHNGWWRFEIERDGVVRWSSLRTKNEQVARAKYAKHERDLAQWRAEEEQQ